MVRPGEIPDPGGVPGGVAAQLDIRRSAVQPCQRHPAIHFDAPGRGAGTVDRRRYPTPFTQDGFIADRRVDAAHVTADAPLCTFTAVHFPGRIQTPCQFRTQRWIPDLVGVQWAVVGGGIRPRDQ
ncbi:hypothetical protein G6F24_016931 [Rhizopus arrhizus]|nr:hypothetical protein G6F24_016931 [Rhizopus arrhizus]